LEIAAVISVIVLVFLLFTGVGRAIGAVLLMGVGLLVLYYFAAIKPGVDASNIAYHKRTIAEEAAKCAAAPPIEKWRSNITLSDQKSACEALYGWSDPEDGHDAFRACVDSYSDKFKGELQCLGKIVVDREAYAKLTGITLPVPSSAATVDPLPKCERDSVGSLRC
jgi:hypothetical protein